MKSDAIPMELSASFSINGIGPRLSAALPVLRRGGIVMLVAGLAALGCGGPLQEQGDTSGSANAGGAESPALSFGSGASSAVAGEETSIQSFTLPAGYTAAEVGGWQLGDAITADSTVSGTNSRSGWGSSILAVIQDFRADKLNFEATRDHEGDDRGIVSNSPGADRMPVVAHAGVTKTVTSAAAFNPFYRTVRGVNLAYKSARDSR